MTLLELITTLSLLCSTEGNCSKVDIDDMNTTIAICSDISFRSIIGLIDIDNPENRQVIMIKSKKCVEA